MTPPLAAGIRTKLVVGRVDDPLEQEADRVADEVMRMRDTDVLPPATPPRVGRKCLDCEEGEKAPAAQTRSAGSTGAASEAPSIVHEGLRSPGQPLDASARVFFEPRFRADFSRVRIHTDSVSAESARAINAVAYTVGQDVVFDEGAYRPETDNGRRLIAHELTHVIQQGGADTGIIPDSENEFGDSGALKADRRLQPYTRSDQRVQRQEACYCCITSVAIKNISRIDNATQMGHSYDLEIKMARSTEHGPRLEPECTLEWWERTNVPYTAGMAANTWTNMFQLVPGSPTFNPWNNRSTQCDTNSTVTINDPPALGKRTGRTVTRTLEFDLKVKSGPGGTCADSEKSATATQVLTMVNGAPDWANSSFA
jgi:hypothetical protein